MTVEERRAKARVYLQKNKVRVSERRKQYYMRRHAHFIQVAKEYREKNREKLIERSRSQYAKNKKLTCLRARCKQYGIAIQGYYRRLQEQNRSCAICHRPEIAFPFGLCIDHNHTTGWARGLLCPTCNISLGHFERLHARHYSDVLAYLRKWDAGA